MKWFRATSFLLGLGLVLTATGVTGQEKAAKKDDKKEDVKKDDVKKEDPKKDDVKKDDVKKDDPKMPAKVKDGKDGTSKGRGQLPTYWGQLGLTDLQKQNVYKIQGKHNEESDKLELQIKEMKGKMVEERSKILTPEQKTRLEDILKTKAGTAK